MVAFLLPAQPLNVCPIRVRLFVLSGIAAHPSGSIQSSGSGAFPPVAPLPSNMNI